ncbi:MAG: excinuclease ABC subunit UvrA [Phycisphaerales bacterium]|nr:excinuclease ABC subunit UvrA [Phycisphaerales bacterium]
MEPETIEIKNAREHNLRSVSLSLPRNSLICFTGVSGSGKSSLAFDTLYAEGQRRYIESLSSYARQFMGQMQKPDCDLITGLSPAIAIQQKTTGWNPRSTVGTVTAIQDFLRVLFARIGTQHCTKCGRPISAQSVEQIVASIMAGFGEASSPGRNPGGFGTEGRGTVRLLVLAPVARGQKGEFRDLFDDLIRAGYVRARVDGEVVALREDLALEKNRRHDIEVVIDRLTVHAQSRSRLAEAVQSALGVGKGTLIIAPMEGLGTGGSGTRKKKGTSKPRSSKVAEKVFSSKYACTHCDLSFEPPSPQLFSFNSPTGMCMTCDGLGELFDFDPDLLVPDPTLNFWAPCIAPMRTRIGKWRRHIYQGVAKAIGFDLKEPWSKLSKKARDAMLFGTGDRHITYSWRWSGGVWKHGGTFDGVIEELREKYRKAKASFVREYYEKYMRRGPCPDCQGARLNHQALAVRLPTGGKRRSSVCSKGENLTELCAMSIADAHETIDKLTLTPVQQLIAEEVLKEIRARLEFLLNVGLHYLTLDRTAPTLSGGELQRIRLAGQIGSGLVGVLYILDEPSIGLHARDNERLLESLIKLRDMGNTVVVVEHDEATMRAADHIVDFGPGPGVRGGKVVASGEMRDIVQTKASLTGRYLAGGESIAIPERRPVPKRRTTRKSKRQRNKAGENAN